MLKKIFAAAVVSALAAWPFAAQAAKLNLATADGYVKAMRKFQCSLTDNKPVTYWWLGTAYGRTAGQPDKVLFNVEGMNTRRCVTVTDEKRGTGFRLVSREILLYKNPQTGEILRQWANPYTGQTVEVLHVANDPVNQPPIFGTDRDGKPLTFAGTVKDGQMWLTATIPLFYPNPLAGDFQKNVGGFYHATEMFNFFVDEKDLLDGAKDQADVRVAWQRMSDWLPWMEMNGREGLFYLSTAGRMLRRWEDLPQQFKDEIAANYPIFKEPPPADDNRPNETSWTYFKKKAAEKSTAPRP